MKKVFFAITSLVLLASCSVKTNEEKARELLKKRYTNQLRVLTESKSEDAFSAFENAYAHAIDPHTSYLSPDDSAKFMDEMSLAMEGIGAVLTKEDDYVKIVSLIPGSPAEMSKKLKPNDYIIGIRQHDGKNNKMLDVVGMRLEDVVPMVKGKKGSKVTLEIQRDNGGNVTTFTVDLVRSRIRLEDSAAKGEVRALTEGTAKITVQTANKKKATITVTVK